MSKIAVSTLPLVTLAFLAMAGCTDLQTGSDEGKIESSDKIVGAMYHHWYTPERWAGNDFVYTPELGAYDSSDPDVVQQHVEWAREAGINTFVIDTWITPGDQWWMNRNTPNVVDVLDREDIKYFFFADGWFDFKGNDAGGYDAQAIASHVNANLSPYFPRPGYLKVGGRPVIFFWATDNTSCALWNKVRAAIEGTVGPVYMTGFNGGGDRSCWDRLLYYNPYDPGSPTPEQQLQAQHTLWSNWSSLGQPWAPTASPGYNDTLVRAGNPPIDLNPGLFRQSIRAALEYPQTDPDKWLLVCSFNEWHETSVIEPRAQTSDSHVFLRILREELTAAGWFADASPPAAPSAPPSSSCDPTTQPSPHYGERDGQCLPSCGGAGGAYCKQSGSCESGDVAVEAFDCSVCCAEIGNP